MSDLKTNKRVRYQRLPRNRPTISFQSPYGHDCFAWFGDDNGLDGASYSDGFMDEEMEVEMLLQLEKWIDKQPVPVFEGDMTISKIRYERSLTVWG